MKTKNLKLIIIILALSLLFLILAFSLLLCFSYLVHNITSDQDAEYDPNQFGFKLDAAGNVLPATATNHSCVQYGNSIWEVKTDDGGLRDKDWTYTWYDSNPKTNGGDAGIASGGTCYASGRCDTEKFVADVNAQGLCGHNDWRLPLSDQLGSMVEDSIYFYPSSIGVNYFPNTVSNWFWTVEEMEGKPYAYLYDTSYCAIVRLYYMFVGYNRDGSYTIRLVRNVK